MKFFDKIKNTFRLKQKSYGYVSGDDFMRGLDVYSKSPRQITDPFSQHSWVYAAITSIADKAGSVPFRIAKQKNIPDEDLGYSREARIKRNLDRSRLLTLPGVKKGIQNYDFTEAGPFFDLFRNPNPYMSPSLFWQLCAIFFQRDGEVFLVKQSLSGEPVGGSEIPRYLIPVAPNRVRHEIDPATGYVKNWFISGMDRNGNRVDPPFSPDEIVHIYKPNPEDICRGLSPMIPAGPGIRQDYKASTYNEAFFDNSAQPGVVLTHPGQLTEEQARQAKKVWESTQGGSGKDFRLAVVHSGMKIEAFQRTHEEMSFIDQRKWNREEILAIWKVPKMIVGVYEDINYATSQTAQRLFWQDAVIPMLRTFEESLIHSIFIPAAREAQWGVFDLSSVEALREDMAAKAVLAKDFFALGVPFNEINSRLEIGFDPIEGGDIGYLPSGLLPVDSFDLDLISQEEDPQTVPQESEQEPIPQEDEEEKAVNKKRFALWKTKYEKILKPGEQAILGKLRRYFLGLRAEVLKNLYKNDSSGGDASKAIAKVSIDSILFALAQADEKLKKQMRSQYVKIMESSWKDAAKVAGSSLQFEEANPRILAQLENKLQTLTNINKTIQGSLRKLLIKEAEAKSTVDQIAKAIKQKFNRMSAGQALTIARTETGSASEAARSVFYQEEGVQYIEWVSAHDQFVRESHQEVDGEIVALGSVFSNGLKRPLDPQGNAEETINCRCISEPANGPNG